MAHEELSMKLALLFIVAFALAGCAETLIGAGIGVGGYKAYQYEFKHCRAVVDGQFVSRHWARLHPQLAHCE
jgi:predicted small secreted protein